MYKKRHVIWALSLLCIIVLVGCGGSQSGDTARKTDVSKPRSWGQSEFIFTFADDFVWDSVEYGVLRSLEREFLTTKNERLFTVRHVPIAEIKEHYRFANLLFFCDTSSDAPTSKYVKEILATQVAALSDSMPSKMLTATDLWAQDQIVVFLIGKDMESLLNCTAQHLNIIFEVFQEKEYERMHKTVYRPGVNDEEINYQKQHYPWHIKLPKHYIVFRRDDANNFVSYLLRVQDHPDRFLAVYWEEMSENNLSKEWLWEKRQEIGETYYEGDTFSSKDVVQSKTEFLGYDAFKLSGRWQNPDYFIGGAFTSFAFYEPEQEIAYLIDNMVYYPQGEKLRALMGLEVISKTFTPNYPAEDAK